LFSFDVIDGDGRTIEFSWRDTQLEESTKPLGSSVRGMALHEDAPLPPELRLPVSLFLSPRRIELRLRTLDPVHSLGHGNGVPEADPADVGGTARFRLRAWNDLS
jgi:hypothetical protein